MPQCLLCFQLGKRDAECETAHPDQVGHQLTQTEAEADKNAAESKEKKK